MACLKLTHSNRCHIPVQSNNKDTTATPTGIVLTCSKQTADTPEKGLKYVES